MDVTTHFFEAEVSTAKEKNSFRALASRPVYGKSAVASVVGPERFSRNSRITLSATP